MALLYYASYLVTFIAFAFAIFSLASGLLYLSELIEEYSTHSKTIGQRGTYVIIALHVVLYFTDSLPLLQTLFSIACHVVYFQNFSNTWPVISLTSISFLASCVLVIADHFVWFFYFSNLTRGARNQRYRHHVYTPMPSYGEITAFFGLCIWLVPLFLFLSLSANDNALPTTSSSDAGAQQPRQSRVSLFRSLLTSFLPDSIRPKGSRNEGLIAPPSPGPQTFSSPYLGSAHNTPPRSPVIRQGSYDSPNPSTFRVNTPPPPRSSIRLHETGTMSSRKTSSTFLDTSKKD